MRIPARRLCNFVFAWALERVEPKKVEEWRLSLEAPLPWEDENTGPEVEMWSDEDEAATWAQASANMAGGGR